MRIACVGGGPAGLFLAVLLSRSGGAGAPPEHEVTVFERHPRGLVAGWGVVFFDGLLEALDARDAEVGRRVREHAFTWRGQVIDIDGRPPFTIDNDGQSIRRATLVDLLTERALELGVDIRYEHPVASASELDGYDLVVAADGVRSALRSEAEAAFGTRVDVRPNQFAWLGTTKVFDSFTFPFVSTPAGWVWAHAYGFDSAASSFIVEMAADTWAGLGLGSTTPEESLRVLERLFARQLDGHPLLPQPTSRGGSPWAQFPRVTNERWRSGRVVLLGDAAHSTHYSIGSGTRLALADAMALADALDDRSLAPSADDGSAGLDAALARYEEQRRGELAPVQVGALNSAVWFEDVPRYIGLGDHDFATMFDRRRTSLHRRMPVSTYLRLSRVAAGAPGLGALGGAASRLLSRRGG